EAPRIPDALVSAVTPELADAIATSRALEARDRYQRAREMGRALHDAALGVPPVPPAAGAGPESATQSTSVLSRTGRSAGSPTQRTRLSPAPGGPRQPRAGPPRQRQAPVAHSAPAGRRPRRRPRLLARSLRVPA